MILKFLLDMAVSVLCAGMTGLQILTLPVDLIGALATVIQYGQYVIGVDLFAVILGSVAFWITVKCSVGLLVFIWKLLPLT